jgi:heat shock protein HslJ
MRIIGAIVAVLIIIGLSAFIYQQKRADDFSNQVETSRVTLTGVYGCLPQKETDTSVTDECAFGIKTDEGLYYAIDFGLLSTLPPVLSNGMRIRAIGRVTPLRALSTDYWQKYPIEGIFSVTDSVEVLEETSDPELGGVDNSSLESGLFGNRWVWDQTEYRSGEILEPRDDNFVLSFNEAGTMNSTTDCNSLSGDFAVDGEVLSFGPFMSTLMYCDGSLEGEYGSDLALTNSYEIVGDELRLNLNRDFGVMVFRAVR